MLAGARLSRTQHRLPPRAKPGTSRSDRTPRLDGQRAAPPESADPAASRSSNPFIGLLLPFVERHRTVVDTGNLHRPGAGTEPWSFASLFLTARASRPAPPRAHLMTQRRRRGSPAARMSGLCSYPGNRQLATSGRADRSSLGEAVVSVGRYETLAVDGEQEPSVGSSDHEGGPDGRPGGGGFAGPRSGRAKRRSTVAAGLLVRPRFTVVARARTAHSRVVRGSRAPGRHPSARIGRQAEVGGGATYVMAATRRVIRRNGRHESRSRVRTAPNTPSYLEWRGHDKHHQPPPSCSSMAARRRFVRAPVIQGSPRERCAGARAGEPLSGLASDAEYIASFVNQIDGPALLVGHSYGGAVISVAGAAINNAVRPRVRRGVGARRGRVLRRCLRALRPTPLLDAMGRTTTRCPAAARPSSCRSSPSSTGRRFAADLPSDVTEVLAVSQRPFARDPRRPGAGGGVEVAAGVGRRGHCRQGDPSGRRAAHGGPCRRRSRSRSTPRTRLRSPSRRPSADLIRTAVAAVSTETITV